MATVMLNAFDRVVIETVGVGQREIDVAFVADTTCLVVQPGAGDSVQFLKSGIMEIPDLMVVNKADLGALAQRARCDLMACLARDSAVRVLSTSATHGTGIDELAGALDAHHQGLLASGRLEDRRRRAQVSWVIARLREEFGSHGLARLATASDLEDMLMATPDSILARAGELRERLLAELAPAVPHRAPDSISRSRPR